MSDQNRSIVEQAYNNFKSGDIEALLNLMSDDITCDGPPDYTYKVAYNEAVALMKQLT
jgi:ketosteroid isomerase-like protein